MSTPAFRLQLTDARQLRAALTDARQLRAALTDARQLRAALTVGALPETTRGAARVVTGRVPMLSTTGTPPVPMSMPWGLGGTTVYPVVLAVGAELREPEPFHYVPGALRPAPYQDTTEDHILVTDAAGEWKVIFPQWRDELEPPPGGQALEVVIGDDAPASVYPGGGLTLTGAGGTGPYTWDFVANRTGGTLTAGGEYVAGPVEGVDRLRVTDSLGGIALVQVEVQAVTFAVIMTGSTPQGYSANGYTCMPFARIVVEGGQAPYTVEVSLNQTGATIAAPRPRRVAFTLLDQVDGAPGAALDLTGWTFDARLYGQRGGVLASGLPVAVSGNVVEIEIPEPGELLFTPAVLRVEAETAGAILALGYPTVALETLLIAHPEET